MPYCRRCGAHLTMKARFCEVCGAWLTTASTSGIPRDIGSGEALIGYTLDGVYRLDEVINRGATAVVYRGTNIRLGQQVAIKVLLAAFLSEDPLLSKRFEAEAKVQAKLRHPHIIAVQDFVSTDHIYSIIMEYFEGTTLDQLLYDLDGPMPVARIREVIDPVCDAIGYAHEQGVIHRDIKPSNIILARIDGHEYPKVMDFGIAKVLAETAPTETAPGAMLGTLLYMSPEQCKALKTIDRPSDIYSLGVTLYQMATGMVPFYADSAFDIMMAHVQTPPPPPRLLIPAVPARLEDVILKALEKDPAHRFQTIEEMRQALAMVPTVEENTAPRPSPPPPKEEAEPVRPTRSSVVRSDLQAAFPAPSSPEVAGLDTGEVEALDALSMKPPTPQPMPSVASPQAGADADKDRAARAAEQASEATFASWGEAAILRMRLRVPSSDEWDRFFDPNIFGGGIFVPTETPPEVGTPVRIEITFVGGPRFFVRGVVTWRRTQLKDPRARAGVGVQAHPAERNKVAYVNSWARGAVDDKRRNRRLPIKLMVTYSARTGRRVNFTRDIHEEGIFLRSRELLDLNTPIRLLIVPPDHPPCDLKGRVTRLVRGQDDRGMGVHLHFTDDAQRERFARLVDSLEQKFLSGELADEVIS